MVVLGVEMEGRMGIQDKREWVPIAVVNEEVKTREIQEVSTERRYLNLEQLLRETNGKVQQKHT